MKWNPVYRRELTINSRSVRLAAILLIFDSILAVAALLNMYSVVGQVKVICIRLHIFLLFCPRFFGHPGTPGGCSSFFVHAFWTSWYTRRVFLLFCPRFLDILVHPEGVPP